LNARQRRHASLRPGNFVTNGNLSLARDERAINRKFRRLENAPQALRGAIARAPRGAVVA
jgi:hypothetical protein